MSKKNTSESITINTLKIKSPYICPNCGEKYYTYVSKKGKQKGINFCEYHFEGLFRENYYYWYHCFTCGHKWEIKK